MELPANTLYDSDINDIAAQLHIPHFYGTFMSDEISTTHTPYGDCNGIVNLQPHTQRGSHWTAFARIDSDIYYFDSFGQHPPDTLIRFLKNKQEYEQKTLCIKCNSLVVQKSGSTECGSLCLYFLVQITRGIPFDTILRTLHRRINRIRPPPLRVDGGGGGGVPSMENRPCQRDGS